MVWCSSCSIFRDTRCTSLCRLVMRQYCAISGKYATQDKAKGKRSFQKAETDRLDWEIKRVLQPPLCSPPAVHPGDLPRHAPGASTEATAEVTRLLPARGTKNHTMPHDIYCLRYPTTIYLHEDYSKRNARTMGGMDGPPDLRVFVFMATSVEDKAALLPGSMDFLSQRVMPSRPFSPQLVRWN